MQRFAVQWVVIFSYNGAAGTSVEVAIGVVVSVVLLILLVVGTVLTVMIVRRKMSEHKERQQA